MTQQAKVQSFSLEQLQQLCDDCKLAINEQQDAAIKQAMLKVCDSCRQVKAHVPELMELRRHIHEMNEKLPDSAA
jgi:ribosome-binding protein aMBF1 (putative translation factor)